MPIHALVRMPDSGSTGAPPLGSRFVAAVEVRLFARGVLERVVVLRERAGVFEPVAMRLTVPAGTVAARERHSPALRGRR